MAGFGGLATSAPFEGNTHKRTKRGVGRRRVVCMYVLVYVCVCVSVVSPCVRERASMKNQTAPGPLGGLYEVERERERTCSMVGICESA